MPHFFLFEKNNPYLDDPDVRLMLRVRQGDRRAFDLLLEKHYPSVFSVAYRFTGSRETAEDLAQEVFIRIYNSARRYRPRAKFQTWAYRITKNLALNELRRLKRGAYSLDAPVHTPEGTISPQLEDTETPDPQQALEDKDMRAAVRQAILSLPDNQRMAVILHRYQKLSYDEIAKAMGCSMKAVKSLLNRAKENLRIRLSGLMRDE